MQDHGGLVDRVGPYTIDNGAVSHLFLRTQRQRHAHDHVLAAGDELIAAVHVLDVLDLDEFGVGVILLERKEFAQALVEMLTGHVVLQYGLNNTHVRGLQLACCIGDLWYVNGGTVLAMGFQIHNFDD